MSHENRVRLANCANEIGRAARYRGAPLLTADSGKATIERWLQWCDPNGMHISQPCTGDDCTHNTCGDGGYETLLDAWDALATMCDSEVQLCDRCGLYTTVDKYSGMPAHGTCEERIGGCETHGYYVCPVCHGDAAHND